MSASSKDTSLIKDKTIDNFSLVNNRNDFHSVNNHEKLLKALYLLHKEGGCEAFLGMVKEKLIDMMKSKNKAYFYSYFSRQKDETWDINDKGKLMVDKMCDFLHFLTEKDYDPDSPEQEVSRTAILSIAIDELFNKKNLTLRSGHLEKLKQGDILSLSEYLETLRPEVGKEKSNMVESQDITSKGKETTVAGSSGDIHGEQDELYIRIEEVIKEMMPKCIEKFKQVTERKGGYPEHKNDNKFSKFLEQVDSCEIKQWDGENLPKVVKEILDVFKQKHELRLRSKKRQLFSLFKKDESPSVYEVAKDIISKKNEIAKIYKIIASSSTSKKVTPEFIGVDFTIDSIWESYKKADSEYKNLCGDIHNLDENNQELIWHGTVRNALRAIFPEINEQKQKRDKEKYPNLYADDATLPSTSMNSR